MVNDTADVPYAICAVFGFEVVSNVIVCDYLFVGLIIDVDSTFEACLCGIGFSLATEFVDLTNDESSWSVSVVVFRK